MPDGWACDEKGQPTNNPTAARMLEPSGDYKGFGLSMMIDILCAGFMDGPFGPDILPMYGSPLFQRRSISHLFVVISIRDFVDIDHFRGRMKMLGSRIRSLEPLGMEPVKVPGDPELLKARDRTVHGIPVSDEKFAEFQAISADFDKAVAHD
jgi:LDH2 family malate/lactate/ureidoglycolate dehydrogenase